MKPIEFNPSGKWKCQCLAELGEFLGDGYLKIHGSNSQVYEIRFQSLSLVCDKCGRDHVLQIYNKDGKEEMSYWTQVEGELGEGISPIISNPGGGFWWLFNAVSVPHFYQKKLMAVLTVPEQRVYRLYEELFRDDLNSEDDLHMMVAQKSELSLEIVKKHHDKIWGEILRIRRECEHNSQNDKKISTDKI